jgi:glycosyltransferase involved in cell wall biosynthesis
VLLVGNYAPDRQHSMQRYATLLARELKRRLESVDLLAPGERLPRPGGEAGKWIGHFEKYILFGLELAWRSRRYDVIHLCDHGNALYLWLLPRRRTVVTCHDCISIRAALGEIEGIKTRATGRLAQRLILARLAAARQVICVSEATRADLVRLTGRPPEAIAVIPNILPTPGDAAAAWAQAPLAQPSAPYFIHVGSDVWYKNRAGTLRIFAGLVRQRRFEDHRLLLVGRAPGPDMLALAAELRIGGRLIVAGEVSDTALQACYRAAEALLFPSLLEGFGWPIIEAQAAGCPVVTSDEEPMRQVAGSGAILIDPRNTAAAVDVILEGLVDRERLITLGKRNVERFAPGPIVDVLLDVYQRIAEALHAVAGPTGAERPS